MHKISIELGLAQSLTLQSQDEFRDQNAEAAWSIFKNKIMNLTKMHVPLKQEDGKHKKDRVLEGVH